MKINKIKSNAKLNLALNITGKKKVLHKIESIIGFIDLHDVISINQHNGKKHHISFYGKFSKNIGKTQAIILKLQKHINSQCKNCVDTMLLTNNALTPSKK